MRTLRGSFRRSLAVALLATMIVGVAPVAAHAPTSGGSRGAFSPDQGLGYRFGGAYDSWVTTAVQDSLDTKFRNWNANNSHSPKPVYSATGPAVVYYSAASISPCSGTNPGWLQCATGGGAVTWRIYVRDLDRARYAKWRWWDKTQSCGNAPTTCWYLERAMIHEAGHAVPTFGHDDGLTENDTVMRSYAPVVGAPGGNHFVFQRCDQAALQLLWDVAKFTLPYGDCFDDIPGHGSTGLVTTLTATTGTFSSCVTAARLIRGRLAVQNTTYYGLLADNPIAGRTVWFDRKRSVDAAWTLRAESVIPGEQLTGYNWARAFTAPGGQPGSIDYRAHFDGDKGLDPSAQPTFTINWLYGC